MFLLANEKWVVEYKNSLQNTNGKQDLKPKPLASSLKSVSTNQPKSFSVISTSRSQIWKEMLHYSVLQSFIIKFKERIAEEQLWLTIVYRENKIPA